LIRNPRTAKKYETFIKRKSEDIDQRYTPTTPKPSDHGEDDPKHDFFGPREDESQEQSAIKRQNTDVEAQKQVVATSKPQPLRTRLAVSSMISYFGDRILTPEMMRAMIILYVGPYNRPDFTTDYLLCPAVAPENLLARFPKTYFLTGERDPLVDDTVIFAGRLRQAKLHLFQERQEVGLEKSTAEFNEKDHVEVTLIPGISHGFIQFVSIFPEGWKHIFRCGSWISEIFDKPPHEFEGPAIESRLKSGSFMQDANSNLELASTQLRHHHRTLTGESIDDDAPLVMSSLKGDEDSRSPPKVNGVKEEGQRRGRAMEAKQKPDMDRSKSLASLGSEEDLLKRRMKGLTVGLMGSNG